jgi:hypothetical protein
MCHEGLRMTVTQGTSYVQTSACPHNSASSSLMLGQNIICMRSATAVHAYRRDVLDY